MIIILLLLIKHSYLLDIIKYGSTYLRPSYFNDTLILAILASALTNAKFYTR